MINTNPAEVLAAAVAKLSPLASAYFTKLLASDVGDEARAHFEACAESLTAEAMAAGIEDESLASAYWDGFYYASARKTGDASKYPAESEHRAEYERGYLAGTDPRDIF